MAAWREVALTAFTHAQTDIGDRPAVAAALTEHRPSLVGLPRLHQCGPRRDRDVRGLAGQCARPRHPGRPTNCKLHCSRFEQTFGFRARPWAEASPPGGKHQSFREQHLMKPGFKLRRRRPDSIPAFSAVFA
jgi:hypothetical protein